MKMTHTWTGQWLMHEQGNDSYINNAILPLIRKLANIEVSLANIKVSLLFWKVEQFHLLFLNWCWHSSTASFIPAPKFAIMSGYCRHNFLCRLDSPRMLSQNNGEPIACSGSPPTNLKQKFNWQEIHLLCSITINAVLFRSCLVLAQPRP